MREILTSEKVFMVDREGWFMLFEDPLYEIEARSFREVLEKLREVDNLMTEGLYLAGFMTYEAGYPIMGLEAAKRDVKVELPLLWFGVFEKPKTIAVRARLEESRVISIRPEITSEEYVRKIQKIKRLIRDGYVYQVNFTFKMLFEFEGDPLSLFLKIRRNQKVNYGRFVKYKDTFIISNSPELFFEVRGRKIITRPMKGTARRGGSVDEDRMLKTQLLQSEKDRAENLMIVDLLRNDLGKIAKVGSVKVEKIFEIEKYKTVFQMTSTVSALLEDGVSFSDIIMSLFPGGSVTGAPKRKAMEVIMEVEPSPRGVYTGTVGYISPSGHCEFNMAIRTPIVSWNKGEMGVGSGITWYSESMNEYQECILKCKFLDADVDM